LHPAISRAFCSGSPLPETRAYRELTCRTVSLYPFERGVSKSHHFERHDPCVAPVRKMGLYKSSERCFTSVPSREKCGREHAIVFQSRWAGFKICLIRTVAGVNAQEAPKRAREEGGTPPRHKHGGARTRTKVDPAHRRRQVAELVAENHALKQQNAALGLACAQVTAPPWLSINLNPDAGALCVCVMCVFAACASCVLCALHVLCVRCAVCAVLCCAVCALCAAVLCVLCACVLWLFCLCVAACCCMLLFAAVCRCVLCAAGCAVCATAAVCVLRLLCLCYGCCVCALQQQWQEGQQCNW